MQFLLLRDLAIIFAGSLLVILLFHRLKLPALPGFIVAGVLLGPNALGLVSDVHQVESLAEVGVILLLFTIGIEFSLGRLREMGRQVVVGGLSQVGLTVAASALVARASGTSWQIALLLGFLVALSSTALVLKGLTDIGEIDAPHGRLATGVLIFQDLCVVPMMLVLPFLAGRAAGGPSGLLLALGGVGVIMGGKTITAAVGPALLGYSGRVALLAGLAVSQIGEFSFVLAREGRAAGLLAEGPYQTFLAVAVFTMLLTPFLLEAGPALVDRIERVVPLDRLLPGFRPRAIAAGEQPLTDHVIIAGYGLNGRNLAAALRTIRTPYVAEIPELTRLGADVVIPEEFETSVEIFARVLAHYNVARQDIERLVEQIRASHYQALRGDGGGGGGAPSFGLVGGIPQMAVERVRLGPDSTLAGKSLVETGLRTQTGALVLSVTRGSDDIPTPGPQFRLAAGDVMAVVGQPHQLKAVQQLVEGPDSRSDPEQMPKN